MERTTEFQVIGNDGTVLYHHTFLGKCVKWTKKHFTFSELSGRGSFVIIKDKVTPRDRHYDDNRKYFPEFQSHSNGLFRRYVHQTIITPSEPKAQLETNCVAYIINTFHENHLN